MRYQDIDIIGYQLPPGPNFRPALQVKGPIIKPGLPGAAIKGNASQGDGLIEQIGTIRQQWFGLLRLILEAKVVVSGND
jgi:hypothetical protein